MPLSDAQYDEIFNAVNNNAMIQEDDFNGEPVVNGNNNVSNPSTARQTDITPDNSDDDISSRPPPLTKKGKKKILKRMNLKPRHLEYSPYKGRKQKRTSKDRLLEIQKERSKIGTWIQCCNKTCQKWRYLADCKDPLLVPDKWYCSMNTDLARNQCDIPEIDYSNKEFLFIKYAPGSIVWATVEGYPSWPAMVEEDPDTGDFYWNDNPNEMVQYHVVFFDNKVSRAWVKITCIHPFEGQTTKFKTSHKNRDYQHRIQAAIVKAGEAMSLSVEERIEKFGFAKTYRGTWPVYESSTEEEDGEFLRRAECQIMQLEKLQLLTSPTLDLNNVLGKKAPMKKKTFKKPKGETVPRFRETMKDKVNTNSSKATKERKLDHSISDFGSKNTKPQHTDSSNEMPRKISFQTNVTASKTKLSFKPPIRNDKLQDRIDIFKNGNDDDAKTDCTEE